MSYIQLLPNLLETGSPDHVGICAHVQKQRLCMGEDKYLICELES